MDKEKLNILVLCTGNSARSIMVEALFNSLGSEHFQAYSAGSFPTGKVNPFALEQISSLDLSFEPRSKSWDEFSDINSPNIDLVVTVCANAASEVCPPFKGIAHQLDWGVSDPAAVEGSDADKRNAFTQCFNLFQSRIKALLDKLPKELIPANKVQQIMLEVV